MEADTHRGELIDAFGCGHNPPQHHLCSAIGFEFGVPKLLFESFRRCIVEHAVKFSHSEQVGPELHAGAGHQISIQGSWGGCGT
ncbi:hypothetical protein D3C78_1059670 [compost metagenome]